MSWDYLMPYLVGECYSFCPVEEADIRKNAGGQRVHVLEWEHDGFCLVKEFSRSAAGKVFRPCDVRPYGVLSKVVDHLLENVWPRTTVPVIDTASFLLDRFRAVTQDILVQDLCGSSIFDVLKKMLCLILVVNSHLMKKLSIYNSQDDEDSSLHYVACILNCETFCSSTISYMLASSPDNLTLLQLRHLLNPDSHVSFKPLCPPAINIYHFQCVFKSKECNFILKLGSLFGIVQRQINTLAMIFHAFSSPKALSVPLRFLTKVLGFSDNSATRKFCLCHGALAADDKDHIVFGRKDSFLPSPKPRPLSLLLPNRFVDDCVDSELDWRDAMDCFDL